jgi:hypothetical protein
LNVTAFCGIPKTQVVEAEWEYDAADVGFG